jgi:cobalt/nickel transport system permease protein
MALFAVHLFDGVLPLPWCGVGFALAIALAALGTWRLHERDVPRIALATAAFFVASSIHIKIPPASVHLVLNGLVGVMLGYRAGLALFVGLFLQAVLIGHGGMYVLGVNVVLQALPAMAVGMLFRAGARVCRFSTNETAVWGGALASAAVMATVLLQSGLLWLADDGVPAFFWIGVHLPVAFVEGVVVGFMVHFLVRVKPELLGLPPAAVPTDEFANSIIASDEMR